MKSRADLSAASTRPNGLSKMRTLTMCATSQTIRKIAIAKGTVSALSKGDGSIMARPIPLNKEVESLAAAAEPKIAAISGTKAPVALRMAASLIDEGSRVPLEQGLEMELAHLREIFATKDALTGLLSIGKTRPVFEGA
jgi:enoyl-CoA hydratase/carnithine racemase